MWFIQIRQSAAINMAGISTQPACNRLEVQKGC